VVVTTPDSELRCVFCAKSFAESTAMVASDDKAICAECIVLCVAALSNGANRANPTVEKEKP
jgi:ATP-dependent protease Clp ATPase subunit